MKKSNIYLAILIVSAVASFILFFVALPFMPKRERCQPEEVEVTAEPMEYSAVTFPMVDTEFHAINLDENARPDSVIIIGVESPKLQEASIYGVLAQSSIETFFINEENGCLTLGSNDQHSYHHLDKFIVKIKSDMMQSLDNWRPLSTNTCQLEVININSPLLNIETKSHLIIIKDCKIQKLNLTAQAEKSDCIIRIIDSSIGELDLSSSGTIQIEANNNVNNLKITANYDLNIRLSGYNRKPEFNKNGHRIFIEE